MTSHINLVLNILLMNSGIKYSTFNVSNLTLMKPYVYRMPLRLYFMRSDIVYKYLASTFVQYSTYSDEQAARNTKRLKRYIFLCIVLIETLDKSTFRCNG